MNIIAVTVTVTRVRFINNNQVLPMGTELDYPDEALNALQLSLTEFVAVAQALFPDPNQDPSAFVRFMLAGRLGASSCFYQRKTRRLAPFHSLLAGGSVHRGKMFLK